MLGIESIKRRIKAYIDRQISLTVGGLGKRGGALGDPIVSVAREEPYDHLGPVSLYIGGESSIRPEDLKLEKSLDDYIHGDTRPLPSTQDREGYMDDRHYEYWLSGLQDYLEIKHLLRKQGRVIEDGFRILDFGCASGRVLRHFLCHERRAESWAADMNPRHVEWVRRFLGPGVKVFQNSRLPGFPIEDNFFDLVYAFSVFTHIDALELAWLLEIRRVLKKGGLAFITIHSDHTWNSMKPEWLIYHTLLSHPEVTVETIKRPMDRERISYRWYDGESYSANVFHSVEYIRATWGRFFEVVDIVTQGHFYQDVVLLRKE